MIVGSRRGIAGALALLVTAVTSIAVAAEPKALSEKDFLEKF